MSRLSRSTHFRYPRKSRESKPPATSFVTLGSRFRGDDGWGAVRWALAALAIGFAAPASAQLYVHGRASAVAPNDCDRACLTGLAESYVAGLAKRDPSGVPFAKTVRFTENNVEMPVGEGLWATATGVPAPGMIAADIETGNVAWFGHAEEHGRPVFLGIRLKAEGRKIAEAETVVVRRTGLPLPFGDVTKLVHNPAFGQALEPAQRKPRERLRAVADSYFNTVELNDGQVFAPFHPDCSRLENGISTTAATAGGGGGNAASIAAGCEAQFKLGIYRINKRVRERRYPIIDEERGVVVASGFFDHANWFDEYTLTDGRKMKTALKWPNSISLLEAFKIVDGKIYAIETVFDYVPYAMHNPFYEVVK